MSTDKVEIDTDSVYNSVNTIEMSPSSLHVDLNQTVTEVAHNESEISIYFVIYLVRGSN